MKMDKEIKVEVIRSRRRSIAIEIKRNGGVTVRAPYKMPNAAIKAFIEEKQDWIKKHLKKAKEREKDEEEIEPLTVELLEELFEEAKRDIPIRVKAFAEKMNVSYGRITIKNQKTRWGSCSSKGNLNFNCLLMLAPEEVRDYVVIHELAHRKQMNHSAAFWKEVETMMPEYKERRAWLKKHGNELTLRMLRMR